MRTYRTPIASLLSISFITLMMSLLASMSFAAPSSTAIKGQARFLSTAPLEKIVGTASVVGDFKIDFDKPSEVSGSFKVPVASMKTGNDKRDEHLRSSQWLNADKCTNIEFAVASGKVASFIPTNDKGISTIKLVVEGKMTINCVSQPMSAKVTVKRKGKMIKVGSKFEIKLADFKVQGKEGIVGKKVGESIQVSINLTGKGVS